MNIAKIVLPALLVACAGNSAGTSSRPEVHVWRVNRDDGTMSTEIWARNDSDVPAVLVQLRFYSCQNMAGRCDTRVVEVPVEPRQRVRVMQLETTDNTRFPTFGMESRWRTMVRRSGTSAGGATPSPSPGPDPTSPRVVVRSLGGSETVGMSDVSELIPIVEGNDIKGSCGNPFRGGASDGSRYLSMNFEQRSGLPSRIVTVQLDSAGVILTFSDTRGDLRRPPPGVNPRQQIPDPGPRSSITIDVANGVAVLLNQPVDGPATRQASSSPNPMNAESLGIPAVVAALVVKECD